ncbi:MAG: hypothetical protein ACXABV_01230 [Candidatus Thorarchaeota archaeon]|jgi:hypothetical protein
MPSPYKFRVYQKLQKSTQLIFSELRKQDESLGLSDELKGKIGLGGGSGTPPTVPKHVLDAINEASKKIVSLGPLVDDLRDIVKDVYGDAYDAAPVSTGEAACWVAMDSLVSPPIQGRGDLYRSAYIAPYERHLHHQGGYGRPFPPRYKDLFADRGVTAGEYGIQGKRLTNLETIFVPLEGARYEAHGIKYGVVPMLTRVDPEASIKRIQRVAEIHADRLAAITSIGYDTVGYGYDVKDKDGIPLMQKLIGEFAKDFGIPYICDNARGLPFIGTDPRLNHADVIFYSMDKAAEGPTSGLIIGKENAMIPVRRAMGMHGSRQGTASSYGKTAYVMFDVGKEALVGQIAALTRLKEKPDEMKKKIGQVYDIVKEEFAKSESLPKDGLRITKSINCAAVEVNYVDTWKDGELGIPIFSIEDMYAGSNLIQVGMGQMGIRPPLSYDGNLMVVLGQGNLDDEGDLIPDNMRLAASGLVRTLEIITKWSKTA